MSWPDGGTTPFRGEKNTNWEGGYRVPCAIRWPGVIEPGTVINEVGAHEDMLPTLLAAAGDPTVKEKLLKGGHQAIGRTYKVHLDGYDLTPALSGKAEWPRKEFLYWTDDGDLAALRYNQWKLQFLEQRAHSFDVWQEPFVRLRVPKLFTLRGDPFERADHEGIDYERWRFERIFLLVPAQSFVANWLASFKEFPPRQKPASFSLDAVMEQLVPAGG
jgi:arylsulfatase